MVIRRHAWTLPRWVVGMPLYGLNDTSCWAGLTLPGANSLPPLCRGPLSHEQTSASNGSMCKFATSVFAAVKSLKNIED